jgi:predicted nucleic acid-binding protein
MSIVISDTSPVRALNHLGLLHILRELYGRVYVPEAVARELAIARRAFPAFDVASVPYLVVQSPNDSTRVRDLERLIDEGEAAALALALEYHADFVLMDERAGREVARQLGLTAVGVLGILSAAKARGKITAIRPLIDRLQHEIDFRLSANLIDHVLRSAGE